MLQPYPAMRRAIPLQSRMTPRAPFTVRPSSGASARPVKVSGFSPSGISLELGVAKLQGLAVPMRSTLRGLPGEGPIRAAFQQVAEPCEGVQRWPFRGRRKGEGRYM